MERSIRQTRPQLVCIVADNSGSMWGEKAQAATEGLQEMLFRCRNLGPPGADKSYFRVVLIRFSDSAEVPAKRDDTLLNLLARKQPLSLEVKPANRSRICRPATRTRSSTGTGDPASSRRSASKGTATSEPARANTRCPEGCETSIRSPFDQHAGGSRLERDRCDPRLTAEATRGKGEEDRLSAWQDLQPAQGPVETLIRALGFAF